MGLGVYSNSSGRIGERTIICGLCKSILEKDEGYESVRRCKNERCERFNMPQYAPKGE